MKQKKTKKVVCLAVTAVILVVVLAVNIAVSAFSTEIDKFVIGYKDTGSTSATRASGQALGEQIQEEGTVLVKNDNNTLPLSKSVNKVNVFGWASTDWVISGSGSGQVKYDTAVTFLDALEEYGIEYNTELTNMYENFYSSREYSTNGVQPNTSLPSSGGSLHSFNYEFSRLYEPDIDQATYYTDAILANALDFSTTAIVVLGRVSGESNDSPKVQYKYTTKNGALTTDETRTYLEISTEEEALLKYVANSYTNVIVLINSTNVMELGFLDSISGIDACLVVATTGTYGANVIPEILYGDVNPSGRLADTYAYDLSTSSTYANTGSGNDTTNFYTNGSGLYPTTTTHTNGSTNVAYAGVAYTDYDESIYLGYKWYETADEEGFWDSAYAKNLWGIENGYDDVVQYPFGYGLSYTTFSWSVDTLEIIAEDGEVKSDNTLAATDTISIAVTVTNTGKVAGQDVVELYYSAPYTENGVEKSAVTLGAYGKTINVLEPGESERVELELAVEDMASYDCYNLSGEVGSDGGYVLEEGTYTLTLRTDAHTVANDKIVRGQAHNSATITYTVSDDITYQTDSATGNTVKNRFTGTDTTDGVAIDGNSDGSASITYLTRGDFEGTFPAEMDSDRAMTDSVKALNLYTSSMASEWAATHTGTTVVFGDSSQGGLVYENGAITELGITLGTDYDADEWEGVLNRITSAEMQNLVLHGYVQTAAISSIGKPSTLDLDGPNQIGSFTGSYGSAIGFSSIVLAHTWNSELAYSMGLEVGNECATYGISGWYGPATNLHRSPFGGRNYEYYSEDALLSGTMCAKTVEGAKKKGVFCYLKHLALYESESGRDGMYTWCTEQALRELYVKPFEIAVKEGGATGIMTSYGRIGAVWTGGSEALLTELVRGEWGFEGAFLTDYSDHNEYMNADQMVRAGGDLWMCGWDNSGTFQSGFDTTSNAFNTALRTAAKNVIYMWLNALAEQADYNAKIASGEIDDTITITATPQLNFRWYIPLVIGVDVVAVLGCGTWIFFTFKKKKSDTAENT